MSSFAPYGYRPATILVSWIILLCGLEAVANVADASSSWHYVHLLEDANGGQDLTDEIESAESLQRTLGLSQAALALSGGVLFLVWVHRANKNARALGARGMTFTPGWSVGWFFVPFMNLVRPYQAIKEIWEVSDPNPGSWQPASTAMIGLWWAFRIISAIAEQVSLRMSLEAKTLDHFIAAAWVSIASDVFDIIYAALTIWIVWAIHSRQQQKHQQLENTTPPDVLPAW